MNPTTLKLRTLAVAGLVVAAAACESSLGLDAAGNVAMTLQRMDSTFAFPSPGNETQNRSVQPDTVQSFKVTITSIAMLHGASDSNAGQWATVHLAAPITVDLCSLPGESSSAFTFASGQVEAGTYARVRLTIADPTIKFKGNVSFGLGGIAQGGVDYDVLLAGASPSTIEAAVSVDVDASASSAVHLLFNQQASMGSVSLAGSGSILMGITISSK